MGFLPFTTQPNASNCFFCASSNKPLLTAVPVNTAFLYPGTTKFHWFSPVRYSPIQPAVQLSSLYFQSGQTYSLQGLTNIILSRLMCITPLLLWCKENTQQCIYNSPLSTFCISMMTTSQVCLLEEAALWKSSHRKIFIPLLVKLVLSPSVKAVEACRIGDWEISRQGATLRAVWLPEIYPLGGGYLFVLESWWDC